MITSLLALAALSSTPIDIRQYGAVGDGATMCTHSIQQALDEAARNGGTVLVPAGRYLTGTLNLHSNVELHLAQNAVILGSTHRHDYEKGLWYALLLAQNLNHVKITGPGVIDGQGAELAKDVLHMVDTGEIKIPPKGWRPSETERPQILEVVNCQNMLVQGVSIEHSCCWVQTYRNCKNLHIDGIHVDSKTYWNNDGIDLVDCKNVLVSNCDVDAGDDGICLKSDDHNSRCENITVKNCRVRSSASAIKFGTSSHGGFKRIKVTGIEIRNTFRSAVALESVDGGAIEDIEISKIHATHTGNAFFIRLGHRTTTVPPGIVRRIVLKDFDVEVPAGRPDFGYPFKGPQFSEQHNIEPSSIVGLAQSPVQDVLLERIKIRMPGGAQKMAPNKVPERVKEYPEFTMFGELPAWALYARHVRGLKIRSFKLILEASDYRPAFVLDDVQSLKMKSIVIGGADKHPTVVVKNVKDASIPSKIRLVKQ